MRGSTAPPSRTRFATTCARANFARGQRRHHAARQKPLSRAPEESLAQVARGRPHHVPRAGPHQRSNPRALFQHRRVGPMIYRHRSPANHYFDTSPYDSLAGPSSLSQLDLPAPKRTYFAPTGQVTKGWLGYLHKLMKIIRDREKDQRQRARRWGLRSAHLPCGAIATGAPHRLQARVWRGSPMAPHRRPLSSRPLPGGAKAQRFAQLGAWDVGPRGTAPSGRQSSLGAPERDDGAAQPPPGRKEPRSRAGHGNGHPFAVSIGRLAERPGPTFEPNGRRPRIPPRRDSAVLVGIATNVGDSMTHLAWGAQGMHVVPT